MSNFAAFWSAVRELEAELPDVVILVNENTGRISKAGKSAAARALVEHGHIRQASDDEQARFEQREARAEEFAKTLDAMNFRGISISTKGKQ